MGDLSEHAEAGKAQRRAEHEHNPVPLTDLRRCPWRRARAGVPPPRGHSTAHPVSVDPRTVVTSTQNVIRPPLWFVGAGKYRRSLPTVQPPR